MICIILFVFCCSVLIKKEWVSVPGPHTMTMPSQMLLKYTIAWGIFSISEKLFILIFDFFIKHTVWAAKSSRGGMHFMASNNDCGIREYDMEKFQLLNHFRFPWPVNVSHHKHWLNNVYLCYCNLYIFVNFCRLLFLWR